MGCVSRRLPGHADTLAGDSRCWICSSSWDSSPGSVHHSREVPRQGCILSAPGLSRQECGIAWSKVPEEEIANGWILWGRFRR
jgi:hypothetical protein